MLERAPICLEYPLRRALRESKNAFRSRRLLHSAFWSYGAGHIEPTSWWTAFLSVSREALQRPRVRAKHDPTELPLLDFLYPYQTIAFLQRCSYSSINRHLRRRARASPIRFRWYTSSEYEGGLRDPSTIQQNIPSSQKSSAASDEWLWEIVDTNEVLSEIFDKAWETFRVLPWQDKRVEDIVGLLCYSGRQIDQQRISKLLGMKSSRDRLSTNFRRAIENFSRLGDVEKAYTCFCQNLLRLEKSRSAEKLANSLKLLTASVDREDWWLAAILLSLIEKENPENKSWEVLAQFLILPKKLSRLFEFLEPYKPSRMWSDHVEFDDDSEDFFTITPRERDNTDLPEDPKERSAASTDPLWLHSILHLASWLSSRVLNERTFMGTLSEAKIQDIFRSLKLHELANNSHYKDGILTLLQQTNREVGVAESLYLEAWSKSTIQKQLGRPHVSVLGSLLKAFCGINSYWGMTQILNDFSRFYGAPDELSYHLLLTTYSRLGDIQLVKETFDKYCERYGQPSNPEFFNPLIYVYARIGDVRGATTEFQRIKNEYGFQPDTVSWNILLTAHVRVADIEGAFSEYQRMVESGLKPDAHTFGILSGALANRGDTEGVQQVLDVAVKRGIKLTAPLIDTQVQALCLNGEVYEAIDVVQSALKMDLNGSRTRMWNTILRTFAFQRDVYRLMETLSRMRQHKIPFDDMTYAALMACLTRIGRTDAALEMLISTMPKDGFLPKSFHFALVLRGFAFEGNRNMVTVLYKKMVELYNNAGFSADLSYLMTAVQRDLANIDNTNGGRGEQELPHAEDFLREVLENMGTETIASPGPHPGTFGQSPMDSYPTEYFNQLISAFGSHDSPRQIERLFNEYIKRRSIHPALHEGVPPPMAMLSTLMVSYYNQGQHDKVKELWEIAVPRAIQLTRKMDVSSIFEPSRPSPSSAPPLPVSDKYELIVGAPKMERAIPGSETLRSQRFILTVPIQTYMRSLAAQGLYSELSSTVAFLQDRGFALSAKNWNAYIQLLSESPRPADQWSAFIFCESQLMPNFPRKWRFLTTGHGTDPFGRVDWITQKEEKKIDMEFYPGHPQPTYVTMVHLAAALNKFRARTAMDGGKEIQELEKQAPMTTAALSVMPHLKDKFQDALLRGKEPRPEISKDSGLPEEHVVRRNITPRRVSDGGFLPLPGRGRRRLTSGRKGRPKGPMTMVVDQDEAGLREQKQQGPS